MQQIYLIRHGKAMGQEPEALLTDEGREQADRLAEVLADKGIERIVSSPYARAFMTVEPLAERLGLAIAVDDRLGERVLAAGELPNWQEALQAAFADPDLCYEGGESGRACTDRAVEAVEAALARGYQVTAMVTHGALLTHLLAHFDPGYGYEQWRRLTNPDVFRVTVSEDGTGTVERVWTA